MDQPQPCVEQFSQFATYHLKNKVLTEGSRMSQYGTLKQNDLIFSMFNKKHFNPIVLELFSLRNLVGWLVYVYITTVFENGNRSD